MTSHSIDSNLSANQVNQQKQYFLEQQTKAVANAQLCVIIFFVIFVLFSLFSLVRGLKNENSIMSWLTTFSESLMWLPLSIFLAIFLVMILFNLQFKYKFFCLDNYQDYLDNSELITREQRAILFSSYGLKIFILTVLAYGISTLFPIEIGSVIRLFSFITMFIGLIVYSRSAAIRSGFDNL